MSTAWPRCLPEAPRALRAMLDPAAGPVLPPVRAEIFGPLRFAQHGRSLGATHRAARPKLREATFFPRLRSNVAMLRQAHHYIGRQAASGYDITPAAEWLLDNFHLIEAQLQAIHEGLPRSYFRSLPVLLDEPLAGLPRVYGIAWAYVAHTDGAFDEELLVQFLCAYQHQRELRLGEMWALPTTLRVVLVENLRRLAERLAAHKAARELAHLCCDHIERCTVPMLERLRTRLERRGVAGAFLGQMLLRLPAGGTPSGARPPAAVAVWLQAALPDPTAAQQQREADQTADNLSVSNAVTALRAIGDADWPGIVARTSSLMRLMLTAPLFAAEDTATRDRTLHGIERLARRSGRGELETAHALLQLMHARALPHDASGATAVAWHWLAGAGRPALAHALGLREPLRGPALRLAGWLALPTYLGAALLLTLALVHLALPAGPLSSWPVALAAALMLWPASEAAVAVINRLISESARPAHLPRLALAGGIPAGHRVLVVVPALLVDTAGVDRLVHRLHLHHLANPERHAQFGLLGDWADADSEHTASDAPLLAHAVLRIEELNARHPEAPGDPPRFVVLHRQRRRSESEQRWIGWERKRGKLEQLLAALVERRTGAFIDLGAVSRLAPGTRHLLTLDSDTQLPPGRLRELVGVAAHPQNQPRLSADRRRVVAGYGVLQPRIATPLPAPGLATPFHTLFAGQCGIDPYSAASSEVYQDVFGEGSFTGKGLLDVHAVHAVLGGRLPEEQVLSHDLIEGSLARCAALSDVTLVEDAPFHADVAASRLHRWTRGDWQLLPLLLRWRRYPLRGINRWKLVDNLRRSLVPPAALALLLFALAGIGPTLPVALALVLAAFAAGPLMGAVAGFAPNRDDIAWRHFYGAALAELGRTGALGLWFLAMLLQQSLAALDAVGRALWRLGVSRRHLLQWTTAAAAQAAAPGSLAAVARRHAAEPAVALALGAALWLLDAPALGPAAALCALWAASPLWTWWVSRPSRAGAAALPPATRAALLATARDTWRYFERCVGPADRHLPPDNLQISPHEMLAHRTSPTNIGLYLLSTACAREFGWIGTPELMQRLQDTLATLGTLERHRGHFLNWYDTRSGAPLLPMYVSTVDSGNLSGHLLAVAQACLERARQPAEAAHAAPLRAVAARCEQFAWEPDFGFLFHPKRQLLHIGWRVAEQQLDTGFYDLLASESRLTSLLAIAKGDVPVRHWAALGRPFFAVSATAGLRSWSGSMFEYLMPTLVLAEPEGSVLRDACRAAVDEQIAHGRAHKLPWGVSESAYAGCDHTLAYQYAPQGVPRLALRRTPPDELVVAPYASVLAALVDAPRACANLKALRELGAYGDCGYIEALDFTPGRQLQGERGCTRVDTFMAHHQGMSIAALANVLLDGVVQRWGIANPAIEAVASLLHERAPRQVPRLHAPAAGPPPAGWQRRSPALLHEILPGTLAVEPTQLLSNGRYTVALRANGAGFSRRAGATPGAAPIGVTRWRDDALRDEQGSFLYLRRDGADEGAPLFSLTQHPAPDPAAAYAAAFHSDRVTLDATWTDLHTRITVWVSPEDDIEFRQVELHNGSAEMLEIELVSAFEVTLAEARADAAHPAFSNLFVSASWHARAQALVFSRTPRLAGEAALHAAHFVAHSDAQLVAVRGQVDRQAWRGRNRATSRPLGQLRPLPAVLATDGEPLVTGLDPVCVLGLRLRIAPHSKAQITLATAATDDEATLHAVIDKYRQSGHVERASLMSATLAGIRLRTLRLGGEAVAVIHSLTTALLLTLTRPPLQEAPTDAACDRRLLWRFGLSGERPLVLVSVATMHGLGLLRSLAQALEVWAWAGVACDLVVINAEPASYQMALQRELALLRDRHEAARGASTAALHLLRAEDLGNDEMHTLKALARLHFVADGRPLAHPVQDGLARHELALALRQEGNVSALAAGGGPVGAAAAPAGAFSADGSEFAFEVSPALRPARPWINVLSNPDFGTQVSEAGGGGSWAGNSRLNQLTAWSNDPVADPQSEWFLLQDLRTRRVWNVAPSASADPELSYRVHHGQGFTTVTHRRGDLEVHASWCVDERTAVKQVQLRLVNEGPRTLRLRAVAVAEWTMGADRSACATTHTARHRHALADGRLTALLCTQRERAAGFGDGTAFLALLPSASDADDGEDAEDWTCDRRELFDARGAAVLPDALGRRAGGGLDPCAALACAFTLAPGESAERVFLLGHAASPQAARTLAAQAAAVPAAQRLAGVRAAWSRLLSATEVRTPDPLFDALVNRWLLYQAVTCRLWAKAGFYQAGGATGFRDQLQDTQALAWAAPRLLREQIVLCASRQFEAGDVQHWWHAPGGAGVRTHFSDDLLWLPQACAHYLRTSGDMTLLDEAVPFIEGSEIAPGAEDAYDTPRVSARSASVYEHAALAIDRSLRVGAHGLPLMGSGDWNDGMNRVGAGGHGESVWLAWFLCRLVADFGPLARGRGEAGRAGRWEAAARGWAAALEGPGWDGDWYRRAYFDDGEPLGAHANPEARIDLIAQAWSVLGGAAPLERQRQAMEAVHRHLADPAAALLRLLDPPLRHARPSAGYIQAYPPGVRENGGQYSHAGAWAVMAQVQLAHGLADPAAARSANDRAWQWFTWLSPAHRASEPVRGALYGLEPYVMAGDIASQPPYTGRGGWSWYTGAAAWMHRAALESFFGLAIDADGLSLRPALPSHWPQAELTLRRDGRVLRLLLLRSSVDRALASAATRDLAEAWQLLLPSARLRWHEGDAYRAFVVPLAAPSTD